MKKPIILVPAVVASVISGPVTIVFFGLQMNGPPIASGMGTSGLVGPIGVITGWLAPSEIAVAQGAVPISPTAFHWVGLFMMAVVLPAVISFIVSEIMRKKNLIQLGDMKIDC